MSRKTQAASLDTSDADYLKSEELGKVIAKGMAVLYKTNPHNPVDFLGKWLLNVSQVQRQAVSQQGLLASVRASQLKHEKELSEKQRLEKVSQDKANQWTKQIDAFNTLIDQSSDLSDQLQNLNDHLKIGTKATAVYIGKMVQPKKPITEKDNDQAHLDNGAQPHIHFGFANPEHKFIVDKILQPGQGVTYELFEDKPVEAEEAPPVEVDEDGNPIPVPPKPFEEVLPKFMVVPEVVREGKIHFFKVPRLGSYMAIRLEYETCLFEEALDAGVADQVAVNSKINNQNEEKAAFEKTQNELREQQEADGEVFKPEIKEWEQIETKPYLTRKVQFVCCLNTMGQDRTFTEEERLFALRTVQHYRDRWEQSERDNLKSDIEKKIHKVEQTKIYKEQHEAQDLQELELRAEQAIHQKEGAEPVTEEAKLSLLKKARLAQIVKTFHDPEGIIVHQRQLDRDKLRSSAEARIGTPKAEDGQEQITVAVKYYPLAPEQWKKPLLDLRQLYLIKNPRVLQNMFYLLGYKREQICERGTNSLDFKHAKEQINDSLFHKIATYNPSGRREGEFKEYQKLSFLKNNLKELEEDKIEEFSLVMAKLLKWIHLAIDIRVEDVIKRRDQVEYAKMERDQAIKLDNARKEKYDKEINEKKQIFEEAVDLEIAKQVAAAKAEAGEDQEVDESQFARPSFDERDFKAEFDAANPEIIIPAEVKEEIDNDYDLPYTPPTSQGE